MFVQHFFVKGLAHVSYLLGGKENCAIIDPKRDIQDYLDAAKDMGYKITHILETHLHADFVSGHMDLAGKTGAKIIAPKASGCKFEHNAVSDGDEFQIDHLKIKVIDTPGHTPDGVCYIVTDTSRGEEPAGIFSGDTLFVGDVGRPDLFPGMADELAEKLFKSLGKIMELPDFVEVYPAHGAGSLCGKAMSAKRTSTIGYERRYNNSLKPKTLEEFKKILLAEMPAAPDHFSRCSATNGAGPAYVEKLPKVKPLSPAEFNKEMENGCLVLDIRSAASFGGQHIPGSIHIDITSNFQTFAGWILPVEKTLLLVADSEKDVCNAVGQLRRVGLDIVKGWLDGGIHKWAISGLTLESIKQISVSELKEMCNKTDFTLLDVRAKREFDTFHIEGAKHMAAPDTRSNFNELTGPVFCMCSTGHRSSMAASILKSKGIKDVANVAGGVTGWAAAGFTQVCPVCQNVHGPEISNA